MGLVEAEKHQAEGKPKLVTEAEQPLTRRNCAWKRLSQGSDVHIPISLISHITQNKEVKLNNIREKKW